MFADGHPVATSASYIATSTGNEHTLGGVISGEVKGKASFINYSTNVFIEGKPVPRNGDPMVHNHGSPFNAMSPAIVQPMVVPMGGPAAEEDKRRPVPIGPLIPVFTLAGILALLARFGSVLNPAFMVPIMPGTFANPNAGKET